MDGKTPGIYIGQYTDFTQTDSPDVTAYTWAKVKGDNDIIASNTAPERKDCMWLDTTIAPGMLKKYNTETEIWEVVNDFTADIDAVEQTVTNFYNTAIQQTRSEIISTVMDGYISKDDQGNIEQSIKESVMEQTKDAININFKTTSELISSLKGVVDTNKEEINKFIRFIEGRIELGENSSAFSLEITNEKISFQDNGSEIAYISNSQLVITDANIRNSLSIGKFHFIPRSNGNMSIKYIS